MYQLIADTKILVIDDFAGFRQTIKTMLARLGAQHIDQASTGNEAIKLCNDIPFDIIFCDYNLGEGQDGQQILEELHHRHLMKRGVLFIMVTAETTRAQVMGAIEYRPDAYLTKPFTGEQLGQRLKRLSLKNQILKPIYDALNASKTGRAIELCELIAQKVPKMKYSCLRIQSELLEQQGQLDEALTIYQQVTTDQPVLWALIGIGRIFFNQGKLDDALQKFELIRAEFAEQVSVLDWIAKCQQALDQLDDAEKTLQQAIQISPKSVSRQAALGQVASQLEHTEVAQKAFSKTIYEGNHSCKLKPEYYREYYDNTRQLAQGLSGRELSRLVAESETMEKKMSQKLQGKPDALAANLSSAARLFSDLGKTDKSSRLLKSLSAALEHPDCKIDSVQADYIADSLQDLPEQNDSNKKLIAQVSNRVTAIKQQIKTEQAAQRLADEQARKLNAEGLQLTRQKQPQAALEKFRQAIELASDKNNFALNAAQIIIEHPALKEDESLHTEARGYLTRIIQLDATDVRWKRFQKLRSDLQELTVHA